MYCIGRIYNLVLDYNETSKIAQGFDHSLWERYYLAVNVVILKEINYIIAQITNLHLCGLPEINEQNTFFRSLLRLC